MILWETNSTTDATHTVGGTRMLARRLDISGLVPKHSIQELFAASLAMSTAKSIICL